MSETITTGGCQCGAVRYALSAPLRNGHVCHCRMCQRASGGLFIALAGVPKQNVEWTHGAPAMFASSNIAERGFCAACGTPLSFAYTRPDATFYVTIGSLDDPEAARVEMQFGIESRISWVRFCEDIPAEQTAENLTPDLAEMFTSMRSGQNDIS